MEPIAVNETSISKRLFYEAMAAADNYRRSALKSVAILAVLWAVLLIVTFILDGSMLMAVGELILLVLIGLWLVFFLPRSKYRRAFKALKLRSDGDLHRKTEFYDDYCVTESAGIGVEVTYEEIIAVRRTDHLLVLTSRDKTGLMLAVDGFTKGDCLLVEALIESGKQKAIPETTEEQEDNE